MIFLFRVFMTCGQVIVKDGLYPYFRVIFPSHMIGNLGNFPFFRLTSPIRRFWASPFLLLTLTVRKRLASYYEVEISKDLISFRERNSAKLVNCFKYCIVHLVRTGFEYKHLLGCGEIYHYFSLKIMQQRVDSLAAC